MAHGEMEQQRATAVPGGSPSPEMNVFEYLRVLCKYRRMVLVVCGLVVVSTAATCYFWPPHYTAIASVMPPLEMQQGRGGLGMMGLLGAGEAALLRDIMDTSNVTDTYVGILNSRAVADALVERFDLTAVYRMHGSKTKARKRLEHRTSISVSDKGIIHVQVLDYDRQRAAELANAYVEELDRQNKRLSVGQAASKRAFLETRLKEVEQKLSQIDSILSQDAKIQEMLYELLVREYEMAKIEEARSLPTIQVLDPAVPAELRDPRGMVRKSALAGLLALIGTMFVAFGREYAAEYRRRESLSPAEVSSRCRLERAAESGARGNEENVSAREGRTPAGERRWEATETAHRG